MSEEVIPEPNEQSEAEKAEERVIRWHRLMGMVFRECFKDYPIGIDTETDVSIVEQRVDIVLKLSGAAPLWVSSMGSRVSKPTI